MKCSSGGSAVDIVGSDGSPGSSSKFLVVVMIVVVRVQAVVERLTFNPDCIAELCILIIDF